MLAGEKLKTHGPVLERRVNTLASRPLRNAGADIVTFMFTDMEGSTPLIERIGDREAYQVFKTHDDIIRGELASFGVSEVERHGDGFLLAFESASSAVFCSVAVQRAFAAHGRACPRNQIRVRIGVHTGPVIRAARRFFGKSVIVAARITAEAKGGEVLVSEPVLDAARAVARIVSGEPRTVELKGLSGTYVLHPIVGHRRKPERSLPSIGGWVPTQFSTGRRPHG